MSAEPGLSLLPVSAPMKHALSRSRDALTGLLGLRLLDGWPQFPEAFDPHGPDLPPPWGGHLFVVDDEVVGNGGFTGPPDPDGRVEIGYEIAPSRRNRGHATAAGRALLGLVWENGATQVIAHSLAEWNASNRVMHKIGLQFAEAVPNLEVGTVWRFAAEAPSLKAL